MTQKISADPGVRCPGHHDRGDHTSFQCVLDAGHAGYCQPYRAPDVDEWRRLCARAARMEAEAAELLAIIDNGAQSGGAACIVTPDGRRMPLTVPQVGRRDIDAETVAGVQAERDEQPGIAGRAST